MLADRRSPSGGHETGHGRDVQGRLAATRHPTGADDVDRAIRESQWFGHGHHCPNQSAGLLGRLALDLQADQKAGDLCRFGVATEDLTEDGLGLER